jgi:acetyl-CoA carboxylase carboxyl transferase subunit beta
MPVNGKADSKMEIPGGLWVRCEGCGEILYRKTLEQNLYICSRCSFHFRISARKYIEILLDANIFGEYDPHLTPDNPLDFPKYPEKLADAQKKTSADEGFIFGKGTIDSIPVILGLMDFNFMGGSMGSVVGEKVARAIRKAREERVPLTIISTSGGARMQEGIFSLMQMAKTSAELALLAQKRIPYISVVTNPTMAGVMASYASLGDIVISEPKALLGFAGARVIEGTIGEKLPEGFQTAEFLLKHGFVDIVVSRKFLKSTLAKVIEILWGKNKTIEEKLDASAYDVQ